jgi:hypothetical protein
VDRGYETLLQGRDEVWVRKITLHTSDKKKGKQGSEDHPDLSFQFFLGH